MLQQSLKARQSVTKSHIGAVNRSQQAYRLESKVFANTMADLGVQIPLSTNDYTYFFGAANATLAEFKATPQNNSLAAYTGCTTATVVSGDDATTASSVQEQPASGSSPATPPSC
jgi:type IV pilus assembly protein PilA